MDSDINKKKNLNENEKKASQDFQGKTLPCEIMVGFTK